jgi:hypothetical protein
VIVDGSTQALTALLPTSTSSVPEYLLGAMTLSAGGPAVMVSGTVYSLAPPGSFVVVDGTTRAVGAISGIATPVTSEWSQSQGIGGIIATLGGFASSSTTTVPSLIGGSWNGSVFTGRAARSLHAGRDVVLLGSAVWICVLAAV